MTQLTTSWKMFNQSQFQLETYTSEKQHGILELQLLPYLHPHQPQTINTQQVLTMTFYNTTPYVAPGRSILNTCAGLKITADNPISGGLNTV